MKFHTEIFFRRIGGDYGKVLFLGKEDILGRESFNLLSAICLKGRHVDLILTCYSVERVNWPISTMFHIDTESAIYPKSSSPYTCTPTNGAYVNPVGILTRRS